MISRDSSSSRPSKEREDLEQQLVRNHRHRRALIDHRSNHRNRRHCLLHQLWRISMTLGPPYELWQTNSSIILRYATEHSIRQEICVYLDIESLEQPRRCQQSLQLFDYRTGFIRRSIFLRWRDGWMDSSTRTYISDRLVCSILYK